VGPEGQEGQFLLQKIVSPKDRNRFGCKLPTATNKMVEVKTAIIGG
jgi:hypothetical protein